MKNYLLLVVCMLLSSHLNASVLSGSTRDWYPTISLCDDDAIDRFLLGTSETMGGFYTTLFPTVASVGIPVTEAVEGHRCGLDVGKLTKSGIAIKALGQAGWELANHTLHARFHGAYVLETFSDISKIPEYPNFKKGSVKSNDATIIYVKDENKNYFFNSKGQWEEQPHGYEQPLLKDFSGTYVGNNPTFDMELEYNENQRRMEQYLNYCPKTFVIPAWSGSQERVLFIKQTHDYVISKSIKKVIVPPLHSVQHRIGLDADDGTTNEANEDLLESWKQTILSVIGDGGSVILVLHAYRTCWSNYLEKELATNGGSYPDEWVHPVNIPTDEADLNSLLKPSAATGIQTWDQWHPCPGTRLYQLWMLIKYLKEQRIAFTTVHDNLDRMKNKVEDGYFPDVKLQPFDEDNPFYYVVDTYGKTYSTSYTLTYVVDGETYKTYKIPYDTTVTPEPAPTKEGYTFSGWSDIPTTMPAKDVTVTGSFTVNKYKLIYMVDGVEYKTQEIEYGAKITPEAEPTKEGYTFSGWSDIPGTMPAMDVTVTGSFTKGTYKLTYMVDGEVYKTVGYDYGDAITPEPAPTKEGYTFSGWSDIPSTMPAKDVTVTGSFTVNKYKLIYMVDGVEYKTYEVEYGTKITPEPAPTKEGYSFSGWSDIPSTMPAKDVTVTGSFTKGTYKLTYMVDGEVYKTIGYDYGDVITPEPSPTKEGYTFSGWSDIPTTMPAKDVTVTGSFTVNKYKLIYMVDGVVYKTQEIEYGAKITPEAYPTKDGYTFSGWSDIPTTMPAKDVTVTGSFTKGTYKLTYMVDGEVYKTVGYDYGDVITPEPAPTKEGYTFSGWSDIPTTMPAKDVTVTGSFTVNKYKLIYMVDGVEYKTQEIEYGAKITPEAEPTKEGYSFSGWSDLPSTMPAKDVTVTGSFTQVAFKIGDVVYEITGEETVSVKKSEQKGSVEIATMVEIEGHTYYVTDIGTKAFRDNKDITSVTIPDGIYTIGYKAFKGCTGLVEICIGKDVNSIDYQAFANVGTEAGAGTRSENGSIIVNCYAKSVPLTSADAFDNTPIETGTLLVEDTSVDAYKTTSPWNRFGTIMGFDEAADIMSIIIDPQKARIYDMLGNRIDQPKKGVSIIRMNDGRTKKVVRM